MTDYKSVAVVIIVTTIILLVLAFLTRHKNRSKIRIENPYVPQYREDEPQDVGVDDPEESRPTVIESSTYEPPKEDEAPIEYNEPVEDNSNQEVFGGAKPLGLKDLSETDVKPTENEGEEAEDDTLVFRFNKPEHNDTFKQPKSKALDKERVKNKLKELE